MRKNADFNIEFGHIYSGQLFAKDDKLEENIAFTKMVLSNIKAQGHSYSTSVLIDDYTIKPDADISKDAIFNYFDKYGLAPDLIIFESAFCEVADEIIETLPTKYLHKKDNSLFFFFLFEDLYYLEIPPRNRRYKSIFMKKINNIPLDESDPSQSMKIKIQDRNQTVSDTLLYTQLENEKKYSCALLATAWYLARLGIPPFSDIISKSYNSDNLFAACLGNVLSVEYLRVEGAVRDILNYSRDKKIHRAKSAIKYFFH